MQFAREINRLLGALLVLFGIVAVSAAYWAVAGPSTIVEREDNPRRVIAEASILRGALVDRDGTLLATSTRKDDGTVVRAYPHPETYGALGYYSLRYGADGAELLYDSVLRGDDQPRDLAQTLAEQVLHEPRRGTDVKISLDDDVQAVAADALAGHTGAVVALAVPSGEILAIVSLPTYDPNQLDQTWDALREDPGRPFFNRALQGSYQPGGALQTPLLTAALLSETPVSEPLPGATEPVVLEDLTLSCAVRLPDIPLTLREAYAFACPAPFAALAEALGPQTIQATFDTFNLYQKYTLPGLNPPSVLRPTPSPSLARRPDDLTAAALGQSRLTLSPLALAVMTAGIVNDGNAPQPHMLLATRPPDSDIWQPVDLLRPTTPIATARTARQLQDLMRDAVAYGAAQNAGRPNIDIGGHASLAYAGDTSQAWFTGFATLGGRGGIAVAVVIEDSRDPGLAADIGGTVLAAAHTALREETSTP